MQDFINLTEALNWMESGQPFSIVFYTADKKKKTGGKRVEVPRAFLSKPRIGGIKKSEAVKKNNVRSPNHWTNATRNVVLPNKSIIKIHIRLITEFNGKRINW